MSRTEQDAYYAPSEGEQEADYEVVDKQTGELLPAVVEKNAVANWQGISQQPFEEKTAKRLTATIKDDLIEIRPDGMIYLPQTEYRRILNEAFGVGAWALRRLDVMKKDNTVIFDGELWANGRFVASAMGEQDYYENNKNMSWATAVESAKSDCITRCCKDIGIAIDLWNPRFVKNWKEKFAVQVWCDDQKNNKKKQLWRRKDDPPIDQWPYKEQTGNNRKPEQPPKTPEKRAETGHTSTQAPNKGNGKVITEKQLKMMYAIANKSRVDKDAAKAVLWVFGYESAKDVLMDDFKKIIKVFQVPSLTLARELEDQRKAKWAAVDAELGKDIAKWLESEKSSPDEIDEKKGRKLLAHLEKLESPGKPE